jgi:hypothetical protein
VNTANRTATAVLVSKNGTASAHPSTLRPADKGERSAAKEAVVARPTVASPKAIKAQISSQRRATKGEKLVCRYCGSDDLAPSFKKRHDARCRACFKQRYSSKAPEKKTTLERKAKATK